MIKRIGIVIFCVLVALMATTMPVLAIADPDSPPQVRAVYVYEDLLQDGDMGVLIDYYIEYAAIPSETVTESYLAAFIDTDSTTQIATVAPYTFQGAGYTDKGYNRGMVWIYISVADVITYGIDSANIASHKVWLMGNPTVPSGWAGDPPKTTADIDYWQTTGDSATLVALRVLYLAEALELAWGFDMIETTALGSRLTSTGESYFENVITNLRTIAPACFSVSTLPQVQEDIDYTTVFGATIEDGTGTLPVSPLALVEGDNTVDITGAGTFILELEKGTVGEAVSIVGGCTVVGSPAALVTGTNTIETNLAGTNDITVTVNLVTTQTAITDTVTGTGLDVGILVPGAAETLPEMFGMSTMMFSSLLWMGITILICAAIYKFRNRAGFASGGSGKAVMIIFDICIIGGAVLGLLDIIVAVLLFIGFGMLTGYVLFYRHASF